MWDTSDYDYYERLRSLNYPETNAILLCYSIDDFSSFKNIYNLSLDLKKNFPSTPVVLVANKKDLRGDYELIQKLGKLNTRPYVTRDQGENLAKDIGAYGFIECSAKNFEGVLPVFELATKAALNHIKSQNKRSSCCILL